MKLHFLILLTIVAFTTGLLPRESMASEFPSPKVEFSADMTMTVQEDGKGQPYRIEGKIYSAKGKERREVSSFGRQTVIIKTENETLTLMPEQKMYMKNMGPKSHKDPETMVRDGELQMTKEGSERINDQLTTRYRVESTDNGRQKFTGHAWFTSQNIPVRFKGITSDRDMRHNVEINYYNINIAKQNPKLFAAPSNYRLLPTGVTGMGGGPGNMTPEQIEQMKEMMKQQRSQ